MFKWCLDSYFHIKFHSKSLVPINEVPIILIMKMYVKKKIELQPMMTYPYSF